MTWKVVFCKNYGQIKRVLYLATLYRPEMTIVVTGLDDLFHFFREINVKCFNSELDLIKINNYYSHGATARGIMRLLHVIPDIIREKRSLRENFNKYLAGFEGCDVFFSSRAFGGLTFYLVKRMSKRNRVVHISAQRPDIQERSPRNLADFAHLIKARLVYGPEFSMGTYAGYPMQVLFIPDRSLQKVVDRTIGWEEHGKWTKDFDISPFRVFGTGSYDVIYFGHSVSPLMVSPDTLNKTLAGVFEVLRRYFPKSRMACKYHPGHKNDNADINLGTVLPSFVPAEFLYSDEVIMYLSIWSASLAGVKKGLPVALMDLFPFENEELREPTREQLIKMSHSKILFPKSLAEFEKLVAEVAAGRSKVRRVDS
jgi:hypothetical protein